MQRNLCDDFVSNPQVNKVRQTIRETSYNFPEATMCAFLLAIIALLALVS